MASQYDQPRNGEKFWGPVIGAIAGSVISGAMSGGSQQVQKPEPWSDAQPYARDIMGQGQDLYNTGSMNPLEMLGLQNQLGFAELYAPNLIAAAMGGWGQMLNPWDSGPMADAYGAARRMASTEGGQDPYGRRLMEIAREQMTRGFQEGTLPQISRDAITAGGLGGSQAGVAEGLAADRFQRNLGDQQTQLASELYRLGLGSQQAGIGALERLGATGYNTIASGVSGIGNMLNAGLWPSAQQYAVGQAYQNAPWDLLERYNAAITPYASVGTVQTAPSVGSRVAGSLLSGGLSEMARGMFAPGNQVAPSGGMLGTAPAGAPFYPPAGNFDITGIG